MAAAGVAPRLRRTAISCPPRSRTALRHRPEHPDAWLRVTGALRIPASLRLPATEARSSLILQRPGLDLAPLVFSAVRPRERRHAVVMGRRSLRQTQRGAATYECQLDREITRDPTDTHRSQLLDESGAVTVFHVDTAVSLARGRTAEQTIRASSCPGRCRIRLEGDLDAGSQRERRDPQSSCNPESRVWILPTVPQSGTTSGQTRYGRDTDSWRYSGGGHHFAVDVAAVDDVLGVHLPVDRQPVRTTTTSATGRATCSSAKSLVALGPRCDAEPVGREHCQVLPSLRSGTTTSRCIRTWSTGSARLACLCEIKTMPPQLFNQSRSVGERLPTLTRLVQFGDGFPYEAIGQHGCGIVPGAAMLAVQVDRAQDAAL